MRWSKQFGWAWLLEFQQFEFQGHALELTLCLSFKGMHPPAPNTP